MTPKTIPADRRAHTERESRKRKHTPQKRGLMIDGAIRTASFYTFPHQANQPTSGQQDKLDEKIKIFTPEAVRPPA